MTGTQTDRQQGTGNRNDGYERIRAATSRLPTAATGPPRAQITTDSGTTRIAAGVVEKIAGFAAREIPGVYAMGSGVTRRIGQLRGLVGAGADEQRTGVSVQVGDRDAAVDLDVVTWYGQSIMDVSEAVRRNVIDRIQAMTGLNVTEVNINIDDVRVDGDQSGDDHESRGQ